MSPEIFILILQCIAKEQVTASLQPMYPLEPLLHLRLPGCFKCTGQSILMISKRFKILMSLSPSIAIILSGCHCVGISERYGDVIDCVADQQLCLDNCYRPGLDLTRLCRACIHQEAPIRNTGFYPNNNWPSTAPVEPSVPPSEVNEPTEQDEYSPLPPPPVPPVPAAKLPVIDIDSLKEISAWTPEKDKEPTSESELDKVIQSSGEVESNLNSELPPIEKLAPLETIEARPMPPQPSTTRAVSAPATVPPSQRFYSEKQKKSSG